MCCVGVRACRPNLCKFNENVTADEYSVVDASCGGATNADAYGSPEDCLSFVTCNSTVAEEDAESSITLGCAVHNGTFEVTGGCTAPT